MSLRKLQDEFIAALNPLYDPGEAANIWYLVIESLTEINLRTHPQTSFTPDGCFIKSIHDIIRRLQNYEPIQYILNEAWFYDIPFFVNHHVLIPRPETEELVDWIIRENTKTIIHVLDIGTGSGCIPVILKRKIPLAHIWSCDIREQALKVAQKNATQYKTEINFLHLDFLNEQNWSKLPKVDIMVSNPPYIPQKDKAGMHRNVVQYEPHTALFVTDENPLIFYDAIARAGRQLLQPHGKIYVEIHEALGTDTVAVFTQYGYSATLKKDMQGKDRFVKAVYA